MNGMTVAKSVANKSDSMGQIKQKSIYFLAHTHISANDTFTQT